MRLALVLSFRALGSLLGVSVLLGFGVVGWAAPQLQNDELGRLEQLRALGVSVSLGGACGGPEQLATYNMGANALCLSDAFLARPAERSKVLHHELVHVVQDCLDGLASPTSVSLVDGLRRAGDLTERQLNGFFLQHLRDQGNLKHVVATTALLPQDSRQREIEAYALQVDPALVQHLLRQSCRLGSGG